MCVLSSYNAHVRDLHWNNLVSFGVEPISGSYFYDYWFVDRSKLYSRCCCCKYASVSNSMPFNADYRWISDLCTPMYQVFAESTAVIHCNGWKMKHGQTNMKKNTHRRWKKLPIFPLFVLAGD